MWLSNLRILKITVLFKQKPIFKTTTIICTQVQKKEADASKTQANFQLQNSIRVRR